MKFIRKMRRRVLQPELGLTPLIDTAFTLLIVFMVATPMMRHAIKVDLPHGDIKEGDKTMPELIVTVDQKGTIFFNNAPMKLEQLAHAVELKGARLLKSGNASIWLRVHGNTTTVSTLTEIMSCLKKIRGIRDVKIETELDRRAIV